MKFSQCCRHAIRYLPAIGALMLVSCASPPPVDIKNVATRIDNFLSAGVESGFSGAVLIVKNGNVVLNRGYGHANKDEGLLNTPDTVFDIGSVTKQFTATGILLLSDSGKLRLTDPLARFFDALPEDKRNITIHQLLTHTAGFIDSFGDGDFDHIPQEQFFEILFATDLLFPPGSRHEYSNAGYSVLARIIELSSGMPYEAFLAQYVFEPAGMYRTGYLLPAWKEADLAHGYMLNVLHRGTTVSRYREDGRVSWHLKGNGGINSTQNDMYLWYQALEGDTVLSKQLTRKLTTPYIPEQEGGSSDYAYGWAIYTSDRNTKIVNHNGGNGAYFHDFLWLPEDAAVIILSSNAASRQVELAWTLEEMLFDRTYEPKPIIKNVYQFVLDFVASNVQSEFAALEDTLRKQYSDEIGRPQTLNRLGYLILRSEQNLYWAAALFELNTRLFERDGNAWDSLGDGYQALRQLPAARKAYEEAVRLGVSASQEKIVQIEAETPD